MKIAYQILCSCCLTLWLAACATLPASNAPYNQSLPWSVRQTALSRIQTWQIDGLLAIKQGQHSQSASVSWAQTGQHYTLSVFGPLGINGATLTGSPGKVVLTESNGQKISAKTPEALLAKTNHWILPVSNLYYWIRGLPAPHLPGTKRFDQYHHLTQLTQQGWQIQYLRYTGVEGQDLPSLMTLKQANLSLKIVISRWKLR